jgi:hypothetical protein
MLVCNPPPPGRSYLSLNPNDTIYLASLTFLPLYTRAIRSQFFLIYIYYYYFTYIYFSFIHFSQLRSTDAILNMYISSPGGKCRVRL